MTEFLQPDSVSKQTPPSPMHHAIVMFFFSIFPGPWWRLYYSHYLGGVGGASWLRRLQFICGSWAWRGKSYTPSGWREMLGRGTHDVGLKKYVASVAVPHKSIPARMLASTSASSNYNWWFHSHTNCTSLKSVIRVFESSHYNMEPISAYGSARVNRDFA